MGNKLTLYDRLDLFISRNDFIILYKKLNIQQLSEYLDTTESTIKRYLYINNITKKSEAVDTHGNNPVPNIVIGTTKDNVKVYTKDEYERHNYVKREIKSVDDFVGVMQYQLSKIKKN